MINFWIALFFFLLFVNFVLAILVVLKKPKKKVAKEQKPIENKPKQIDSLTGFRNLFSGGIN